MSKIPMSSRRQYVKNKVNKMNKMNKVTVKCCIDRKLPDDLLLKIFGYLSLSDQFKLRRVNKHWRMLLDYILQKKTELVITKREDIIMTHSGLDMNSLVGDIILLTKSLTQEMIYDILVKMPNLRTLYLNDSNMKIDMNVSYLYYHKCLKKLENLIIKNAKETISTKLCSFAIHCGHRLRYVQLDGVFNKNCIKFLIKSTPNLKSFAINLPSSPHNELIARQCYSGFQNKLEEFYCNSSHICQERDITALCQSESRLTKLEFVSAVYTGKSLKLTCQRFPFLTRAFFNIHFITNKSNLRVIPLNLHHLENLVIILPSVNCDDILLETVRANHRLNTLHIECGKSVTDCSVKLISNYCSMIEKLIINPAVNITDISLNGIGKLSHLKLLYIPKAKVTPNGLLKINNQCPELKIYF